MRARACVFVWTSSDVKQETADNCSKLSNVRQDRTDDCTCFALVEMDCDEGSKIAGCACLCPPDDVSTWLGRHEWQC